MKVDDDRQLAAVDVICCCCGGGGGDGDVEAEPEVARWVNDYVRCLDAVDGGRWRFEVEEAHETAVNGAV